MKKLILTLVIIAAGIFAAQAQSSYVFAQRDSALSLDVYPPTAAANGYTVVHVFGGGFIKGSRSNKWDADYCRLLAANGYTAVAIDYRLGLRGVENVGISAVPALEKAFYMAAEDCASAVGYLVGHAAELGIQADKIILEGVSAGAITVLMTDFGRCNKLDFAACLPEGWKPAGVVAYSGAIYSNKGALKWAEEPAPTLLFHGTEDKIVTYKKIAVGKRGLYGADAVVKRLDKFDYPYCVYRFTSLGHEVSMGGPLTIDELNLFVKQHIISGRRLYEDITKRDAAIRPSKFTKLTLKDLYKKKTL